ncbi:MAG: hypothetical protein ACPGVT_05510 [Maricaulaceae bacterium]
MVRIEDMSELERQSWITLLADIAVFGYFKSKMTNGFELVTHSASDLGAIYIALIIATIIMHIVIASIFTVRKRDEVDADERDREIESRGDRAGFWCVTILVNIIIFTLLAEYTFPDTDYYNPPMSVMGPSNMFFALISVMFIGDIVKRAVMVWEYRR